MNCDNADNLITLIFFLWFLGSAVFQALKKGRAASVRRAAAPERSQERIQEPIEPIDERDEYGAYDTHEVDEAWEERPSAEVAPPRSGAQPQEHPHEALMKDLWEKLYPEAPRPLRWRAEPQRGEPVRAAPPSRPAPPPPPLPPSAVPPLLGSAPSRVIGRARGSRRRASMWRNALILRSALERRGRRGL